MKQRIVKSITAMIGAIALIACSGSIQAQAAEYPDVQPGQWFYPYVQDVSNKGLMGGYDNGYFGPTDKLTRGQFATILWRMEGSPDTGNSEFPDVSGASFYNKASEWARVNGVITGYNDGRFGGEDNINREQVATILYRYSGGEANGDIWSWDDGWAVSNFAQEGMSYAVGNGIITGDNGYLNPQGTVVRAVAATMISRLITNSTEDNKEQETPDIPQETPDTPDTPQTHIHNFEISESGYILSENGIKPGNVWDWSPCPDCCEPGYPTSSSEYCGDVWECKYCGNYLAAGDGIYDILFGDYGPWQGEFRNCLPSPHNKWCDGSHMNAPLYAKYETLTCTTCDVWRRGELVGYSYWTSYVDRGDGQIEYSNEKQREIWITKEQIINIREKFGKTENEMPFPRYMQ